MATKPDSGAHCVYNLNYHIVFVVKSLGGSATGTATRSFKRTYGIKCPILPTPRQITFLQKNFGCARKIYNLLVEEGNRRDAEAVAWHNEDPEGRADKTYPHKWTTEAEFKKQYPYLKEADSLGLVAAREHYHEARSRHYEGAGRPKFKSKGNYPRTYTTKNQGYQDDPNDGTIRVYKCGSNRDESGAQALSVQLYPSDSIRFSSASALILATASDTLIVSKTMKEGNRHEGRNKALRQPHQPMQHDLPVLLHVFW